MRATYRAFHPPCEISHRLAHRTRLRIRKYYDELEEVCRLVRAYASAAEVDGSARGCSRRRWEEKRGRREEKKREVLHRPKYDGDGCAPVAVAALLQCCDGWGAEADWLASA